MTCTRQLIGVLWPAFLLACGTETVVFAFVDPASLHWGGDSLQMSRQGIYTVAFFVFWAMAAAAGAFTALLSIPSARNPGDRP